MSNQDCSLSCLTSLSFLQTEPSHNIPIVSCSSISSFLWRIHILTNPKSLTRGRYYYFSKLLTPTRSHTQNNSCTANTQIPLCIFPWLMFWVFSYISHLWTYMDGYPCLLHSSISGGLNTYAQTYSIL